MNRDRAMWTVDRRMLEQWGRRGLRLAAENMDRIVALCREWNCQITLVVYPWPDQVMPGDRDSIQVRYWRDWAAKSGLRFVDGFAPFFREPAHEVMRKYYFRGDTHFDAAGHRLLFEEPRQAAGEF